MADRDNDPLDALPELVRFGVRVGVRPGLRATQNLLSGAVSVTGKLAEVILGEEDPVRAAGAIRGEFVDRTRESFALPPENRVEADQVTDVGGGSGRVTSARLKRKGAALLARSADLDVDAEVHPAFDAMLEQMAPDEARIVRVLGVSGTQPVIDIEARSRIRGVSRRSLARNVGRLAADAGCRYPERVDAYLDNLSRLGLIRILDEEAGADKQYEVLSVQPAAVEATKKADDLGARARVVRHSVGLSALGEEFFSVCLE